MSNKYGNDLLLFNGDLVLSDNGDFLSSEDYEKVSNPRFPGYYNIIFSVFNRMNTIIGELPLHPQYGSYLPLLVSQPNNKNALDKVKESFTELLNEDPRVKEVYFVDLTQSGNKISVKVNLLLNGKSEGTTFIFPNFFIE
jgi:phage baseplate assembly protein W